MSQNMSRRAAVKLMLLTAVAAVAVAIPASVWAAHQFNDVAHSHPFHNQISAIAGAGITTGFPDGGYHPSEAVTRQAMAAFLERGLGRIGFAPGGAISLPSRSAPDSEPKELTRIRIDPGASGAGSGFVHLLGTADISTSAPANCPCKVDLLIRDAVSDADLGLASFDIGGAANESGGALATGTVQAVVRVTGKTTRTFKLTAFLDDMNATGVEAVGTLSAQYVPFGPDGDDTLRHCPLQEAEPNGSIAAAKPVTGGVPMYGCVQPPGDTDFFSITVPSGYGINAVTMGHAGPGTCDMDTFLRIWNSAGTVIASNDDSSGLCSLIETVTLSPATYYVEVKGLSDFFDIGAYRLDVTLEFDP